MLKKSKFLLGSLFLIFTPFLVNAQTENMYMFGHSLVNYVSVVDPPSDETTIAHWIYLLAQASGRDFASTGQWGFLPGHSNLPPTSAWGYSLVPPVWDSELEPFSAADFTSILITAGNFDQWQPSNLAYPGTGGISPLSATETIMDWVDQQEDSVKVYIYENWPDMAPFLGNNFPPTDEEFANYNSYTLGAFHDWWIEYQDFLLASRPNRYARMIPVGPIMARIFTDLIPNQIPYTDLYEDGDPHGKASIYFLAGLITYMAVFAELPSPSFSFPSSIHPVIQSNYQNIINLTWSELQAFDTPGGVSRVFFPTTIMPVVLNGFDVKSSDLGMDLSWQTSSEENHRHFEVEHSIDGKIFKRIGVVSIGISSQNLKEYSFQHANPRTGFNYYRLKQVDLDGQFTYSSIVNAEFHQTTQSYISIYPNPIDPQATQVSFISSETSDISLSIIDISGKTLFKKQALVSPGNNFLQLDLAFLPKGVYLLRINTTHESLVQRLLKN